MKNDPCWALFDWGGTLMSEDGPLDVPMALWPEVAAVDGARETLAALAPRYRIGVATNAAVSRREHVAVALGRVGLREFVSEILCYAEIGARKESAAFWRAALERLAAPASRVAMVGDTLEGDVLAPRACGLYAIWFRPGANGAAPPAGVPRVARLPEAVPLIDRHFGGAA